MVLPSRSRIVGQIGQFHWVRVYVEKHRAVRRLLAVLRVAPLLGPDRGAVNGPAVLAPDAVSGRIPLRPARIVQQRHQAGSLYSCRYVEARQLAHGAVDVE